MCFFMFEKPLLFDAFWWHLHVLSFLSIHGWCTVIKYDHHIRWPCMTIIYDDHKWWSCIMITYDDHIWWSCMMIIYDENVDEDFEIWLSFRNVWGPLGYALASSLEHSKLSRPSDDYFFQKMKRYRKTQNNRSVIFFRYSNKSEDSVGANLFIVSFFYFGPFHFSEA